MALASMNTVIMVAVFVISVNYNTRLTAIKIPEIKK